MVKRFMTLVAVSLFLTGCFEQDQTDEFTGIVIEVQVTNHLIVEPHEGEPIRSSGTEVSISAPADQNFEIGDEVRVTHEGPVMESHPLQVHLISIELVD